MARRTLDTDFTQIAIDFFADQFPWHHRVLLLQIAGAKWVVGTADLEVQVCDLAGHRVATLPRNGRWPAQVSGQIYAFDPITDAQRDRMMASALRLGKILGADTSAVSSGGLVKLWRVADLGHERFDEDIAPEFVIPGDRAVIRGDHALWLPSEDEWICLQRIGDKEHAGWLEGKRSGPGRGRRIIPLQRDSLEKRRVLLRDAPVHYREAPFPVPGLAVPGHPRDAGVAAGGYELGSFHAAWVQRCGASQSAAVVHEHRIGFDYLQLFMSYDQCDLTNLAGIEALSSRFLIIEKAIWRNPKAPDFSGSEMFTASTFDESGGGVVSGFDKYMAQEQQAQAVILKQSRLWAEERDTEKKKQHGRGGAAAVPATSRSLSPPAQEAARRALLGRPLLDILLSPRPSESLCKNANSGPQIFPRMGILSFCRPQQPRFGIAELLSS